ncbi:MAG: acylphosphatase [Pirellulaceae bacterium]
MDSTPIRLSVWFSGNVQGVGFRQTSWQIAQSHPVSGWVRNLPDGRVEMLVEGAASDCTAYLAVVQERLEENIRSIQQSGVDGAPRQSSFEIIP